MAVLVSCCCSDKNHPENSHLREKGFIWLRVPGHSPPWWGVTVAGARGNWLHGIRSQEGEGDERLVPLSPFYAVQGPHQGITPPTTNGSLHHLYIPFACPRVHLLVNLDCIKLIALITTWTPLLTARVDRTRLANVCMPLGRILLYLLVLLIFGFFFFVFLFCFGFEKGALFRQSWSQTHRKDYTVFACFVVI